MTDVVALTLNYRDSARTVACVRNLLAEGASHVLVWDNSDDSGRSAEELRRHFIGDVQVSVIDAGANLGFSIGVNRGVEWLQGRHPACAIVLINNDARLLAGALDAMLDALCASAEARVAFPDIDHGGWVRGKVHYHRLTGVISDRAFPGSFMYPSGCCLMFAPVKNVRREKVFDEDFFMYGEDWEFGWRMAHRPGSMVHVPRLLVRHEGSASSRMGSSFYEARVVAAHLIVARKLARGALDGLFVQLLHQGWLVARALIRALRYRSKTPLNALREGREIAEKSARF